MIRFDTHAASPPSACWSYTLNPRHEQLSHSIWACMQVGAALSMVYVSGAPIMFVGCGQTYVDLKRLNVKSVVKSLLK